MESREQCSNTAICVEQYVVYMSIKRIMNRAIWNKLLHV